MIRRLSAVAATGVLALGLGAAPALADSSSTPSPSTTVTVNGDTVTIDTSLASVQKYCAHAQKAITRLTALQTRIDGDASTHGSIAWLQAQAAAAKAAGHQARADRLTARAQARTDQLPKIQQRLAKLTAAEGSVCASIPTATPTPAASAAS